MPGGKLPSFSCIPSKKHKNTMTHISERNCGSATLAGPCYLDKKRLKREQEGGRGKNYNETTFLF